jgi:hypothetical protein
MNTSHKFDFSAPFVPAADPTDGLLHLDELSSPIEVLVGLWDHLLPGFYIQLMLNAELIGPIRVLSEMELPGQAISMEIDPAYLLNEGNYHLGFRATNPVNGVTVDSETTPLVIDRTAPGASLLAPALLPDISVGTPAKAKIPGYAGMEPGDLIQTLCNNTEGPSYQVQTDNLTTTPIEILFTQDFLESLQSDKVTLTYHVTDRAGNRSILAQPVELTLAR